MALENPWPQAVASGFVREKIQKVVYVSICLIHSPRAECSNAAMQQCSNAMGSQPLGISGVLARF